MGIHEILSLKALTYTAVFKGFILQITQSFIELSDTILQFHHSELAIFKS
jgi:hypothetical protein